MAFYQVHKESETTYKATLRGGPRSDIPAELVLKKEAGEWLAEPWNKEVMQALVHAIEADRP